MVLFSHDEKQNDRSEGDHEYLTPRPVSRDYHHDIDKVMKQISLAVAKSRGVSSLSRAKGNKNNTSNKWLTQDHRDTDKYPYKVQCSTSLPRPKLKRLKSDRQSGQRFQFIFFGGDDDIVDNKDISREAAD